VALLTAPVVGFALPFSGLPVTLLALCLVPRAGAAPWDQRSGRPVRAAVLGAATLWLLPLLSFGGLFLMLLGEDATSIGTTAWQFIPLCGPVDPWTPAVVATVVYAAGAMCSAVARRPWPWLLGGLAANVAYDLTLHLRGTEFVC
jgi:hypothetical protein